MEIWLGNSTNLKHDSNAKTELEQEPRRRSAVTRPMANSARDIFMNNYHKSNCPTKFTKFLRSALVLPKCQTSGFVATGCC